MNSLVRKAMSRDTNAFSELICSYKQDMYKVAYGILSNNEDVADAIQNAILICFEKISGLKQPQYFKTWLTRILINECNQVIRERKRLGNWEEIQDFPDRSNGTEHVEFCQLLSQLEDKYRIVIILYYAEGYKIPEIADLLEMNENTVKIRLKRAREAMSREYGFFADEKSNLQLLNGKREVL